ncbi:MAG: DHH family phosphoesterase [Nanoarchaeota archaeon]|nr:DHH family phosphoesterase [Nanoarchaeota archaeon]MBU4086659.1 DHH family phosphoesterase [Nanoarchaeota archaeon]
MRKTIENFAQEFLEKSNNKKVLIISHHDTDGITSASIMARALERKDISFSIKIVKQLEPEFIETLPKDKMIVFLDLASSLLTNLKDFPDIFIIDHHEILISHSEIPKNIRLINPHIFNEEAIAASGLAYLFAKALSPENNDLATLAVIGMVGDNHDKNISKTYNQILSDAEVTIKKGLLFYPYTRPIHKTLEFSSSVLIPGVTGNPRGAIELLRECGIERTNGEYPTMLSLSEEENSKLITAVLLKRSQKNNSDILGSIYLVKLSNRLEDAREISAMLNACSRLGFPEVSILLCLGNKEARQKAENIYATYKQHLIAALNYVSSTAKIEGKGYVIINAKDQIKDTIIGTVSSIIANSPVYEEGTIVIGMAYSDDKIKISARISGRDGRNVHKVLSTVTQTIGGECGGHQQAAGALISQDKEQTFLENIKRILEIETVKV